MAEYKYEFVNVRIRDGIAWTFLNRPDKRNAMSPQLHYDMDDALARLEVDENVRVVVVSGEGGNFSAGQDLQKFFRELERNPGERKKAAAAANRWRWERLYNYDKPTIAMVHGFCVGGAFMQLHRLRFRDRRGERDLLAVGGELGHPARRAGLQVHGRCRAAARSALLRLPRRAVRRQGSRPHRPDQLRGAAGKARGGGHRPCRAADEEEPCRAARDQARDPPRAHHGCATGLRLPRRQGPGDQGRDKEDSYNTGLRQFLDEKSYKPTYEPFKLGTMLTDQRSAKK